MSEASRNGFKALVIGCGSIGQRHVRNLRTLGMKDLLVHDPVAERANQVAQENGATACADLDDAFGRNPRAILICTPPHLHTEIALRAVKDAGADLFIEKPIASSSDGLDELLTAAARQHRLVCVGYNLRFHAGLVKMKELLDAGTIGRTMSIRVEVGQYLPDWRPSQDYRQGYIVRRSTGGGIILDASHELDYVRWLGGEVDRLFCMADHLSSLEMEAEDTAAVTMRMRSGVIAEVHLDCVQRGYARTCKIIGEAGTLIWDFNEGIRWLTGSEKTWRHLPIVPDVNEMYLKEMSHFLDCVRGEATPLVDGATGKRVLEIALAAQQSARSGQQVRL